MALEQQKGRLSAKIKKQYHIKFKEERKEIKRKLNYFLLISKKYNI